MTLTKQGPKRRRRTRRELPYGQVSLWKNCTYHFSRELEKQKLKAMTTEGQETA